MLLLPTPWLQRARKINHTDTKATPATSLLSFPDLFAKLRRAKSDFWNVLGGGFLGTQMAVGREREMWAGGASTPLWVGFPWAWGGVSSSSRGLGLGAERGWWPRGRHFPTEAWPHLAAGCEMSQLPARSSRHGRPLLIPPGNTPGSFVLKYGRAKPRGGSVLGAVTPKILWHPQNKSPGRGSGRCGGSARRGRVSPCWPCRRQSHLLIFNLAEKENQQTPPRVLQGGKNPQEGVNSRDKQPSAS